MLEELPLAVGEQGEEYRFTSADRTRYWGYRSRGESALDVPAGGTLTEYQLLEGMLIGSANNYADKLASLLWPNDAVFASAARTWLEVHGVPGITIVEPTGFDSRNRASAASLITLAQKALANPVIAEIVAKTGDRPSRRRARREHERPARRRRRHRRQDRIARRLQPAGGEGHHRRRDARCASTRRCSARTDDAARIDATRALFAQLEQELQLRPSVPAGTTVGVIDTAWGERVEVRTDADASVVLWNGAAGTVATDLSLGDDREAGDTVGTLTRHGPARRDDGRRRASRATSTRRRDGGASDTRSSSSGWPTDRSASARRAGRRAAAASARRRPRCRRPRARR